MSSIRLFFQDVIDRHERLKKRIHSFRIPLSPTGQKFMSLVYFSIPLIGGYYIMQYAFQQAEKNIGKNGEKLKTFYSSDQDIQINK